MQQQEYYLGLDIGTDSVGYAVTDLNYSLLKFRAEPMWGAHLFEPVGDVAARRAQRTSRRRIDRRQQRVALVEDLFCAEIVKIDPQFFRRRKASALYGDDNHYGVPLFCGGSLTDREYHAKYPTIHHLILDLMTSGDPHDIRLVYMACTWLVAHRGHFLFDIAPADTVGLLDFEHVYKEFCGYLQDQGHGLPWPVTVCAGDILRILQLDAGVRKKQDLFKKDIYAGVKISKEGDEDFPYNRDALVALLSGGKVKAAVLYCNDAFADIASVSLQMGDEEFDRIVAELGDDGELLVKLRAMYSCARLNATMANCRPQDPHCISSSKVADYEQHQRDLHFLKHLVKKYCPKQYDDIFRKATQGNYVSYTGNVKSCPTPGNVKRANKETFCDYLKKKMKSVIVDEADREQYEDMMRRLDTYRFLPRQRDTDNRLIPQQLYRQEMERILENAAKYLPMLSQTDADGLTVTQKLLSIFDYRIPYYVGPLVKRENATAWIVRKEGKILPWNFSEMVDLDASENAFIVKMTNRCTYLPNEDVLPVHSLLYEAYVVLNEINNLKADGVPISVAAKQGIFTDLFMNKPRVTVKEIRNYLLSHGQMQPDDELSGVDITIKSALTTRFAFRRLLDSGALTDQDVEEIVRHAAYTEDKTRMRAWLKDRFPQLPEEDITYITRQKLKEFGRLSARFLHGIMGTQRDSDGEAFSVIEMLWNTNCNLMQLLGEKYTFMEQVKAYSAEYYAEHPRTLTKRLSEMYVSDAVKRPIFRTLDIVGDVVKAMGKAPTRIFVEMARGGTQEQKGQRTRSRKEQLLALYQTIKTDEVRQFAKELEAMGASADSRLQSRKLFLYYLQLGKCLYTGNPIRLAELSSGMYNLDHIYPQSQVKDDSPLNNLVLVESSANGAKSDTYPISGEIQKKMRSYWFMLKENGLMTEEKYRRLTRTTPFSDAEKMGFINRQLVETRQSTKVIAELLRERFPQTEIVYVKAGLVSDFRHDFEMTKCRSVNALHHAKDAYLNIVVGNIYHERFSRYFHVTDPYNVQARKLFTDVLRHGDKVYWNGPQDLPRVKKTMGKNAVHLTRYAFCRKGSLFDLQPVKKAPGLVPLKKGMPTEKYGGYRRTTATCYVLAKFTLKRKAEIMLVPVELRYKEQVLADQAQALQYTKQAIADILGHQPENVALLLNGRILKINTVFSFDGTRMVLAGKSSGGKQIIVSPLTPLVMSAEWEQYVKAMESFQNKRKENPNLQPDAQFDGISREKNCALFQILTQKMGARPFSKIPGNQYPTLSNGAEKFALASLPEQISCLMNIIALLGFAGTADLTVCGGAPQAGVKLLSSKLSNWKKAYSDVRIVDVSASGLHSKTSENLLDLL